MLLTMYMLEYQLSFSWTLKRNRKEFENRGLRALMLWQEEDIHRDILYLITPEQFKKAGKLTVGCNLLCPAPLDMGKGENTCNCLYSDTPAEAAGLFNAAQDVFLQYAAWQADVDRILRQTGTPGPALERSAGFFRIPLSLVGSNYDVLAESGEHWLSSSKNEYSRHLPLEEIIELTREEGHARMRQEHNVYERSFREPEERLLCSNLYLKGEYFATLSGLLSTDHSADGIGQLLEYLSARLTEYFEAGQESGSRERERAEFKQILMHLIKGEAVDRTAAERSLDLRGWKTDHKYGVMKFFFLLDISPDYYCALLEQLFPDCTAVLVDGSVYCVFNLSVLSVTSQEFFTRFPVFLRDSLCKAGISNTSPNIFRLSQSRLEADAALRIGRKKQETFWYYLFSDYALDYIAEAASEKLSAWNLAHPAIRTLLTYDEQSQGDLVNSLLQYLQENCSATGAAKALFIHRTTMIHRLKKIQELTGVKLDDPTERLHLQLSFFLLRQKGEL